jgi:hypothetical protein
VGAREKRQANCIDIFLQCSFCNLLGQLMQACVYDFETMIAQSTSDGFGASIMAI